MFSVVYEFTVEKQQQDKFKQLWHELTLRIRDESSSLGASLHKVSDDDTTWVAYAQWQSKLIYDNTPDKVTYDELRQMFIATCSSIKIVYQLECVDNLLI